MAPTATAAKPITTVQQRTSAAYLTLDADRVNSEKTNRSAIAPNRMAIIFGQSAPRKPVTSIPAAAMPTTPNAYLTAGTAFTESYKIFSGRTGRSATLGILSND